MRYKLFPTFEKGSLPIFSPNPPDEEIINAVCDGGGPVRGCDLCGRVHFDLNGEYMEEGELRSLLAKQQENPRKYIGNDSQVFFGYIDGSAAVVGCPCNGLTLYQDFLWETRFIIRHFLVATASANLGQAETDSEAAAEIAAAVQEE